MKCYRMHEKWFEPLGDMPGCYGENTEAVTIYRGYAVCGEHLEELKREDARPSTGELIGSAMRESKAEIDQRRKEVAIERYKEAHPEV